MHDSSKHNPATTTQQILAYGRNQLKPNVPNSHNEALMLLQHITGMSKEHLIAHPEEVLAESLVSIYQHYLIRRSSGDPMAYITKGKEFWSLPLYVTPGVLIPRPETELVVEATLNLLNDNPQAKILDLGTGSGCIALALAKENPSAQIVGCDISDICIETAKINANNLTIDNVSFISSHWFKSITDNQFDIIVSNPPYISPDDDEVENEVRQFEPESALFSGQDGLADILHIIEHAVKFLRLNGSLVIEHGHTQGAFVRDQFNHHHFTNVHSLPDMQQHERITIGTLSN